MFQRITLPLLSLSLFLSGWIAPSAFVTSTHAADSDDLIRLIDLHAEDIVEELIDNGAKVVGVLRFEVRDRGSQNTLGLDCADWLETALKRYGSGRLKVVDNATTVASELRIAKTQTRAEKTAARKLLLGPKYPLSDGRKVFVDTFVTGTIIVTQNLQSLDVSIQGFKRQDPSRTLKLARFYSGTGNGLLASLGVPFHIREGGNGTDAPQAALDAMLNPRKSRDERSQLAIQFELLYDSRPVTPSEINGIWHVPSPRVGQQVSIKITRSDQSKKILGVVVRVNGLSVLSGKRVADFAARKYILAPGKEILIRGFQIAGNTQQANAFEVLTDQQSHEQESRYGDDVGTITFTVFRESSAVANDQDYYVDLAQGVVDSKAPRPEDMLVERNLIVQGPKKVQQPIQQVARKQWDPVPVLAEVIRYYQPKN